MRDMDEIILLVCDFLDKEDMEYVIVGGLAVIRIPENKINNFIQFLKEMISLRINGT